MQAVRTFYSSVIKRHISIKFKAPQAYVNKPYIEESIRADVEDTLKEMGYNDFNGYAEIREAGAHYGGSNPRAGLHSTVDVKYPNGAHVVTLHVSHDFCVDKLFECSGCSEQHSQSEADTGERGVAGLVYCTEEGCAMHESLESLN